jgi:hypothetical protein
MSGKFSYTTICPHVSRRNELVLDILQNDFRYLQQFMLSRPYKQHTVKEFEIARLDLISYAEYGSVELWWLVGKVNNIIDPLQDVKTGDVLRVPSIVQLEAYLQLVKSINRGQAIALR